MLYVKGICCNCNIFPISEVKKIVMFTGTLYQTLDVNKDFFTRNIQRVGGDLHLQRVHIRSSSTKYG